MTPALNHDQHRVARRGAGDSPFAAGRAVQLPADHKLQDRPFIRAGFAYRTGGDAPLVRSNSRTAGGGCIRRQRRRALRLLPGRLATLNSCCAFKSRSRSIYFADQPRRQAIADLSHVSNAFRGVTFQPGHCDTNRRPKSWKTSPSRIEVK